MSKTFFLTFILALAAAGPLLGNKYHILSIKGVVYEAPPSSPGEWFDVKPPKRELLIVFLTTPLKKGDRIADPQRLIFTAPGDSLFVRDESMGTYWLYPSAEHRRTLENDTLGIALGCSVEPSFINPGKYYKHVWDMIPSYEQRLDNLLNIYLELRGGDAPLDAAEVDALHQPFHEHILQQALLELDEGNFDLKQLDLALPERELQLQLPNSPNLLELKLDFSKLEKEAIKQGKY